MLSFACSCFISPVLICYLYTSITELNSRTRSILVAKIPVRVLVRASKSPMATDREVLRDLWDGKLPVCFVLNDEEVCDLQTPEAFYLMVPRLSYFPLVWDKVKYFCLFLSWNYWFLQVFSFYYLHSGSKTFHKTCSCWSPWYGNVAGL